MKRTAKKKENVADQYRELVPDWHRYVERDFSGQSEQQVVSQNYTTYGAGETPIPMPEVLRRA
jgi:hypothetical protein